MCVCIDCGSLLTCTFSLDIGELKCAAVYWGREGVGWGEEELGQFSLVLQSYINLVNVKSTYTFSLVVCTCVCVSSVQRCNPTAVAAWW